MADESPLTVTLALAVPLRIGELQQLRGDTRTANALAWARAAGDAIACHGDVLQYGGTRGQAAGVFNHLARGLAALAHTPGGVTFAGWHWCVAHPLGVQRAQWWTLTCNADGMPGHRPPTVPAQVTGGYL